MDAPFNGTFILSGAESQRLRSYCHNAIWSKEDLDDYGLLLQVVRHVDEIRAEFQQRTKEDGIEKTRKSLAEVGYGPAKIPIFNYLLQLAFTEPYKHSIYFEITRYLALEAEVPVDSTDLAGTTALMYSISTKPYLDIEFAEIMLKAGADIHHRNRYGCVAGHDIVMARDYTPSGKAKTVKALKFFLEKGGSLDVKDGDGVTARQIAEKVQVLVPEMATLLNAGGPERPPTGPASATKVPGNKVGRNDLCICGSKKKYKTCCGKN